MRNKLIQNSYIVLAVLLMGVFVSKVYAEPLKAKVSKVKGNPVVIRDSKPVVLKKDMVVNEGETVKTHSKDFCVLKLDGGKRIVLFQNSEVKVKNNKKKKAVQLDLTKGFSWVKVKKQNKTKKTSFLVKTPSAVAGVRGTSFSASVSPDGEEGFCVCEGVVSVTSGEKETTLKQGEFVGNGKAGLGASMKDAILLKKPTKKSISCLECHQGGNSRYKSY
jgi:hypothetical protein